MSSCPTCPSKNNGLTTPPLLSPKTSLTSCEPAKLSDIRSTHDIVVNWPNVTNINTSIDLIDHDYARGLADMDQTKLPKSLNWIENAGIGTNNYNQVENGSLNQEICGCCWAMSVTSTLGDRFAIKHGIGNPLLSPGWLTACGNTEIPSNGQCCTGGNVTLAAKWCENNGINTESCWPFREIVKASQGDNNGCDKKCPGCNSNVYPCPTDSNCFNGCNQNNHIFKAKQTSTKLLVKMEGTTGYGAKIDHEATTRAIQQEITANGPVSTSFMVPNSFMTHWKNNSIDDIYTPSGSLEGGGHAVALVGWGGDPGNRYWLVRNSWGLTHGLNTKNPTGYMKFAFSIDTTNTNDWTGLDIPLNMGLTDPNTGIQTAQGGVVVFHAGDIPTTYTTTKGINSDSGGSPSPGPSPGPSPPGSSKNNTILYIILGSSIGVLFIGLIIFLYYKYKKR